MSAGAQNAPARLWVVTQSRTETVEYHGIVADSEEAALEAWGQGAGDIFESSRKVLPWTLAASPAVESA